MREKEEVMAECIVKAPKDATMDYDYIAFSFNGLHSYEDFGIYRISDGDRYNDELAPTTQDLTAEVPGGDGMYFFGTHHRQKVFNINFAFDNMEEDTYKRMKKWLNGKEMGDLWFAEHPYKVYTAKVTG
jgi:predicted phage tail component-like protein